MKISVIYCYLLLRVLLQADDLYKTVISEKSGAEDDEFTTAQCPDGYLLVGCEVQGAFSDGLKIPDDETQRCLAYNGNRGAGVIGHSPRSPTSPRTPSPRTPLSADRGSADPPLRGQGVRGEGPQLRLITSTLSWYT